MLPVTLAFPRGSSSKWFLGRIIVTRPKTKVFSLLCVALENQCPCLSPDSEVDGGEGAAGYIECDAVLIDHETNSEAALPALAKTGGDLTVLRPAGNLSGLSSGTVIATSKKSSAGAGQSVGNSGAKEGEEPPNPEEVFSFNPSSFMTGEPAVKRASVLFPELLASQATSSSQSSTSISSGNAGTRLLVITEGTAAVDWSRLEWKPHSYSADGSAGGLPYSQQLLQRKWAKKEKKGEAPGGHEVGASSSSSSLATAETGMKENHDEGAGALSCCGDHSHGQHKRRHQASAPATSAVTGWISTRAVDSRRQKKKEDEGGEKENDVAAAASIVVSSAIVPPAAAAATQEAEEEKLEL